MRSGDTNKPKEEKDIYEHELAFTKRPAEKAQYCDGSDEREDTIPADVERVVNAASTSTLVPTPPQIEEGSERSNNIFPLARQGTITVDLKPSVNDASTSTLALTPPQPPAPSQCYSELEDISDQIRCLGSEELLRIEAFARVDSVPPGATNSSSLGKRSASVALEDLEPPVIKRPRTTIPSAEEPQPLLPDAETSSAANPSSARDIPFIIAHSDHLQKCFDSRKLSCGVQWEIARLVTTKREDPTDFSFIPIERLDSLKGSNAESAEKTAKLILDIDTGETGASKDANARERSAKLPWKELDTEEAAHLKNTGGGGLGFNPDFPGWHGGKVHFCARLKNIGTAKLPQYKFILERAALGPSCLFTRRFMSERFLTIKVPKQILNNPNNGLLELFLRPFVLTGRVFRAFYAKDENVFMIETDEIVDGVTISTSRRPASPMGPCSLQAFLSWHNPLELNKNQVITKWASRFALGLSNSVPGLCLNLEDIMPEAEVISSEGSEMTDGCGYINQAALQRLRKKFEWHEFPTAIQFRLAGCKGLLMLHPDDTENDSDVPRVWIRPSQRKIKYNELDPAQLTIDVLRKSYMKTPTRLSTEVIINLAENGVPHKNIVELFREGLEEHIAGLTKWDGPNAMFDLYCQVARVGGVISARLAREAGSEARVRGYGQRENESSDPDDEDELAQRSTPWSPDLISGCPSSLEETVMVLLDSGFTPQNCPVLREKLKMVVETSVKNFMARYRIDVQMSCSAFVVPDPFGVLKANEIQCKSSHQNLRTANGLETDTVLGDVLITRNPCKLPTDTQKVNAVEKPELRHLTDVIVCPIQGYRRFLDFLAGGDYDGDIATVLYDPRLVEHFKNADLKYSCEPKDLANDFSRINQTVSEWLERTSSFSQTARMHELQPYLLGQIRDTSIVGIYSGFHDVSTYKYGYADERTWRLVYMFCSVLDAIKTGRIVLPSTLIEDRRKFGSRPPAWKETDDAKEKASLVPTAGDYPKREGPVKHKRFIMDAIETAVKAFGQAKRIQLDSLFVSPDYPVVDPDLTAPWFAAVDFAAQFKRDNKDEDHPIFGLQRQLIQDHVHTVAKRYRESMRSNFSSLRIETRQDILRDLAMEFASRPLPSQVYISEDEIARLRASYAYHHDSEEHKWNTKWTRFPWDMAMRELCAIKARALGPFKVVTVDYYERFVFKQSSSRRS